MTRDYFLENIESWPELLELCNDEECDICENIFSQEVMDDQINEDLRSFYVRDYDWTEIRDILYDIPTGYDYYRCDGMLNYVCMNDYGDFNSYKDKVLDWMDDNDRWDNEDDDCDERYCTEAESSDKEPEEPPIENEDFSVDVLFGMCFASMTAIRKEEAEKEQKSQKELDAAFSELTKPFKTITAG